MKTAQTLKLDPDLLKDLKKKAKDDFIPFNRMCENHLRKLIKK